MNDIKEKFYKVTKEYLLGKYDQDILNNDDNDLDMSTDVEKTTISRKNESLVNYID